MVLGSAVAFAWLSILAKLAYGAGLGVEQTLAFRFAIAAAGMWAVALLFGQNPVRLPRREIARLVVLGLVFYTGQALTYFIALRSLPASLCVLIAYIYPSLVVGAGWLFLRRRVSAWHLGALIASFLGVALLVGGGELRLGWALVLAIASPVIYASYILVSERAMTSVPALAASALIMSGAGFAFCVIAGAEGRLVAPATAAGWFYAVAIAIVPTMVAISLFLAGLPRIGAARSSLLSTIEPAVTVTLAVLILGDRFSPAQLAGAALVIGAVIAVQSAQLRRPVAPPAALK